MGHEPLARLLAVTIVTIGVVAFARLQRLTSTLRAHERDSRWASNLRDVVNLSALGLLFVAFRIAGASGPIALLFAGTAGVVMEAVTHGSSSGRPRAGLAAGLAFALPCAVWQPQATELANRLVFGLFPHG